jgi:glyoxylase-like metal-dependent hydrolase (beta-lactamase superfamily II)
MVVTTGEEQRRRVMERYPPELAAELREVLLTPPTELFEESAVIALEDRDVELRYLGRGHTDNDIVVRVPDASVLFAGDLLENAPAPAYGDAFPIAWAETGQRLLGLVDGAVVPGHGDPFDLHFAERQVAEIAAVAELARDAVAGSIGLDEAIRRSPFPAEVTGEAIERARLEIGE